MPRFLSQEPWNWFGKSNERRGGERRGEQGSGVYSFDNTGNSVPRTNTRVSEGDWDT
jgi:hypothetical protein